MPPENIRLTPALIITVTAACLISLLSFGVRSAFGLFTDPVAGALGESRGAYALAIAIQNICWGIGQPLAGVISDRMGARRVLVGGGTLYALGIVGMIHANTTLELTLTAGVMVGLGMGGASYITVLAALSRLVPEASRSWALGLGTASGSLGQFVIVTLAQAMVDLGGWQSGAWFLAGAIALILMLAVPIVGDKGAPSAPGGRVMPISTVVTTALSHPSYLLLVLGFFVCGFQLAFITTHFPPYLADKGLSAQVASWAIALVGLFNVVGAYLAGVWGGKYSKKNLLACVYFGRAAVTTIFLITPISTTSVLCFGAGMGFLWLSTAPLTSGLVATFFGTRYMATLFGIVFLSHQVGSFLGVWMGGYLFGLTGSYDAIWWVCVILALLAGIVNLPIREQPSPLFSRFASS